MAPPSRPDRPVISPFMWISRCIAMTIPLLCEVAVAEPEPLKLEILPLVSAASAITSPDQKYLVSVHVGASQLTKAIWIDEGNRTELDFVGEDKVTRLCFFKNPRPDMFQAKMWAEDFDRDSSDGLRAITFSGPVDCRFEKWIMQVGEKVLPLGLVSLAFQKEIPCAGTPVVDSKGKIVALVLQAASGNTAYAIPVQAIHRVQKDVIEHQKLVRGWLGITMSTGSQVPRITRVLPGSPAEKAGILEDDVLLRAGAYQTERYPDAVNALFYTMPGKPTSLEILRHNERLPISVTPIVKTPGK